MSKHAAAIAHFRKLCCLGLGAQAVTPALLEALHQIVPSWWNRIIVCDDRYQVTFLYAENPDSYAAAELHFREFEGKLDPATPSMAQALKSGVRVGTIHRYEQAGYYRSDHFNEIERPYDVHRVLDVNIVDRRGPLACVLLARDKKARSFASSESALLDSLIPYFAHALRGQRDLDAALADQGRTGLVIADSGGRIRLANGNGVQFLAMAQQHLQAHPWRFSHPLLPPELRRLCAAVYDIAAGRPAPPPLKQLRTAWGLLEFRGSWLDTFGPGEPLVAITIELRVPEKLTLMQMMGDLKVSDRQKDVCLGLAEGLTESQIAQRHGISVTTVAHHLRKLYVKLDVHSQAELLRVLRAVRPAAGGRGAKFARAKIPPAQSRIRG
jgi:DNA-binding CsgD family transcriptional regulator